MSPKIDLSQHYLDDPLPDGVTLGKNERFKYGAVWPPMSDSSGRVLDSAQPNWMIEKWILTHDVKPRGFMGVYHHMRQFMTAVWGRRDALFYLEWNPNAVEILQRYCEYQITSVAGHASAGKSYIFAAIGNTEFILNPWHTKVLVTSYTKQSSTGKIWGDVENCWQTAESFFKIWGVGIPGRLLIGKALIRAEFGGQRNPKAGIELLAGEANEAKESSEKIQGRKSDALIVLADEYATMPISIHNVCLSNLRSNPRSKMLAGFNPDGFHDPGGLLSKPVGGWSKATVDMSGWPTQVGGWCVHFDGEKSPNVLDPRKPWRNLLDGTMLAEMRSAFPPGTKRDDQMVRGWWSQTGTRQAIYDEADIENFGADRREKRWVGGSFVYVAGLDIGNAHGGDKTVLTLGRVGQARADSGDIHAVFELLETLVLSENMALNDSLSEQIVKKVKFELQQGVWGPGTLLAGQRRNVPTANLAVDCTGGGTHFAALLARDIGQGFLMVGFGEKASDRQVSRNDKRKGHEAFGNKVSELWGVPVQLIRTGQIRGLDADTVFELTVRTYKDDGAKRMIVESKDEMKKRTNGQSPDRGDSFVLCVEAARVRGGLSSSEKAAVVTRGPVDREKLRRQQEELFGGYEVLDGRSGGWGE